MMGEVEADKQLFGENTEKAIELFKNLELVQKSRLIMGAPPEEKKKETKGPKEKKAGRVMSEELKTQYEGAIKSAKSKFDHEDTYFEKGGKG